MNHWKGPIRVKALKMKKNQRKESSQKHRKTLWVLVESREESEKEVNKLRSISK